MITPATAVVVLFVVMGMAGSQRRALLVMVVVVLVVVVMVVQLLEACLARGTLTSLNHNLSPMVRTLLLLLQLRMIKNTGCAYRRLASKPNYSQDLLHEECNRCCDARPALPLRTRPTSKRRREKMFTPRRRTVKGFTVLHRDPKSPRQTVVQSNFVFAFVWLRLQLLLRRCLAIFFALVVTFAAGRSAATAAIGGCGHC